MTHSPTIWLPHVSPLYLPKRVAVQLVRSLDESELRIDVGAERELGAVVARLVRHRHGGRLLPARLRLGDYQLRSAAAPPSQGRSSRRRDPVTDPADAEPLSEREREILRAVAAGHSNAEIASQLWLTEGTVKWHLGNIYGKLGARRRTQAVARARELGAI